MFDACHAFGCSHQGRMIGNFGDAEVLSFHATKFVNAFEGGAIVTNNDEVAAKARLMKSFGFAGPEKGISVGTNGKMSEASAAMGLTSLESIAEFTITNYRNYKRYQAEVADIPGITLFSFDEAEQNNYQYIVLTVNEKETGIDRNQLIKILHAENVMARRYFYPGCHRMEPYRSYFPNAGLLLPETEKLAEKVLVLPTGTAVQEADISKICRILKLAVTHSYEIQERFYLDMLQQHESIQRVSA
jgi:dTDP-4-amino-4,6-dideoxygalactose transaminase